MAKATNVTSLRDRLRDDGWEVSRESKGPDGDVRSVYLREKGDLTGDSEIRISDHDLGQTAFGEAQGSRWKVKVTLDPKLSLDDHLQAIKNEDYREDSSGFAGGYSFSEWSGKQG